MECWDGKWNGGMEWNVSWWVVRFLASSDVSHTKCYAFSA